MKRMVLLILALVAGCAILMMVYKQRQNAAVTEQIAELPEDVIEDIDRAQEDISNATEDDQSEVIERNMEMIANDYERDTDETMSDDLKDAIQDNLAQEAEQQ
jgi:flagellar basal body-associated protein FliL